MTDNSLKIKRFWRLLFIAWASLLFCTISYANHQPLTLELRHADLADTIRLIAKFLNMNVIVSPHVNGTASLSLHQADPLPAFEMLLLSHQLASWQVGDIWLIAPRTELMKQKQEELKWQEMSIQALPVVTKIWQIQYSKAEEIARLLKDEHSSFLSKRGWLRVDARTNIICMRDVAERIKNTQQLIRQLDVPVKQILIETRLASVDSDFEQELGIHFGVKEPTQTQDPITRLSMTKPGRYSLAVAKLADGSLLDVKLAALENAGHAELISSPRLFTANQQPASIEAGEEIPYQEVSDSGGTAIAFKKAVLGLKVTPHILPGNQVLLQLQINQDRPTNKMILGVPSISTRQIITSVTVKAGQTVVLGGIYESTAENGEQRIPFMAQLPVIGWLFKEQNRRTSKRELLIFVTPKIIKQL
ncbi:MAG TPA: secretin N-terminal domain-containing protein [Gammaproteobacteria bacterium]|jgi:type IV pilus assembly protein PilQ|nr:secretin N-terminal domain-containing protein [Gammaproteobacteria bacterium]